jgi:hypothetical protein
MKQKYHTKKRKINYKKTKSRKQFQEGGLQNSDSNNDSTNPAESTGSIAPTGPTGSTKPAESTKPGFFNPIINPIISPAKKYYEDRKTKFNEERTKYLENLKKSTEPKQTLTLGNEYLKQCKKIQEDRKVIIDNYRTVNIKFAKNLTDDQIFQILIRKGEITTDLEKHNKQLELCKKIEQKRKDKIQQFRDENFEYASQLPDEVILDILINDEKNNPLKLGGKRKTRKTRKSSRSLRSRRRR